MAINVSANDCFKWSELTHGIFYVDGTTTEKAATSLEALATEGHDEQIRKPLWDAIRQTLIDKQENSDQELFKRLTTVRDAIEPVDSVLKHAWLFDICQFSVPSLQVIRRVQEF